MAENKDKGCWDKKDCDKKSGLREFNPLKPFNKGQFHFSIWYFVAIVAAIIVINMFVTTPKETILEYSVFKEKVKSGEIKRVELGDSYYIGYTATSETISRNKSSKVEANQNSTVIQYRTMPVNDPGFIQLLDEQKVEYYSNVRKTNPFVSFLLSWLLPIGALILIWRVMFRRMGNMGTDVMSFGKNKSLIVAEGETGVRFADVAGVEEAKDELVEVVDFLEHPSKYTAIGGKIPKGVLLVGAPGTGKTMLAKAVAGEAGVPFFRLSGADFVEMFVGVGAARVRDLFRQAREKSPCIIFIDELDAIGKTRASAISTNDEREQTLNQLLVEMDGFDSRTGVIILAATNRPEILDPALLRPGRFDRQVLVDKPDLKGREEILKIHAKDVKIHMEVDFNKVARSTPGLVGADLANIVNEAALLAVRANRSEVFQEDFEEAIEKVIAGLRKKNKIIDKEERRRVAYHETGHAITAYFTKGADPVQKISIVPRGYGALGYTMQLPEEEKYLLTEDELYARVDVLLGGRVCEEIILGNISTGASDDLSKASDLIRKMITDYGMSEKFKNVYLPHQKGYQFLDTRIGLQKEYSEATQQYVDEETARIVGDRYGRVRELLTANQQAIHRVTEALLKEEMLDAQTFKGLMVA